MDTVEETPPTPAQRVALRTALWRSMGKHAYANFLYEVGLSDAHVQMGLIQERQHRGEV